MIEQSETVTTQRTRSFRSADPLFEGLSATIDDADVVTLTFASIEGQSSLRLPGERLAALLELGQSVLLEMPHPSDTENMETP